MTKLFTSAPRCLLLLALAGCGDDPAREKEKDEPTEPGERDEAPQADAGGAKLDASSRDAAAPARDARAAEDADVPSSVDDAGVEDASLDARAEDASRGDARVAEDARVRDAGPLTNTPVRATIVVAAGQTYDGAGKRFVAGSELGDGSQSEDQKPVFKLESGATLRNVTLGSPAADGIHCHGDVKLENIVWEDIGEDAMTIKESGTVELRGGSAVNGDDKVFQINAASTFRVYDFRARKAGKFIRQNGGTKFKVDVHIERCDIAEMGEAIFRTDSEVSTVTMIDTRYSQIGDSLFVGVKAANITEKNNSAY